MSRALLSVMSDVGLGPKISPAPDPEIVKKILSVGYGNSPDRSAVAGFGTPRARDELKRLLGQNEGRKALRDVFAHLNEEISRIEGTKRAFVRGLLRARREALGPSSSPRKDLMDLIYGTDPSLLMKLP